MRMLKKKLDSINFVFNNGSTLKRICMRIVNYALHTCYDAYQCSILHCLYKSVGHGDATKRHTNRSGFVWLFTNVLLWVKIHSTFCKLRYLYQDVLYSSRRNVYILYCNWATIINSLLFKIKIRPLHTVYSFIEKINWYWSLKNKSEVNDYIDQLNYCRYAHTDIDRGSDGVI